MTPPVELREEPAQRDEIIGAEERPTGREREVRVGPLHIGPAGRQRADSIGSGLNEEHPVLAPGVGIADELELAAAQRMERVGHSNSLRIVPTAGS